MNRNNTRILRAMAIAVTAALLATACGRADRHAMSQRLQRLEEADARYEQHTSDKEARALADYYAHHGSREQRAKAFYLAGRVYSDLQDAPQALAYFQQAAATADPDYTTGRLTQPTRATAVAPALLPLLAATHSQMGSLFFNQQILDEALTAYRSAYRCDSLLRDSAAMVFDLRDMANVYRGSEAEDSCVALFEQAMLMAAAIGDDTLHADVQSQLAAYYVWHDQYDRARKLLAPALAIDDEAARSGIYSIAAELCMRTQQLDSAKHYYRELTRCGTVFAKQAAYRGLADIAMHQNQPGEALRCLRLFEEMTDSVTTISDRETLRRMHSLYNYQLRERENNELRLSNARNRMLLLAGGIALALLVAVMTAAIQYYRRKQLLFALRLERLQRLVDEREAERQQQAEQAVQAQKDLTATDLFRRFDRMAQLGKVPQDDDWQELEALVNDAYPDFTARLFSFCRLSDHEYHVSLLQKFGFTPQNIGLLTAHSKQSISNTRGRLYEKTFGRKGKPHEWDEFIDTL